MSDDPKFDLHPFPDVLLEQDRGFMVTVEGETAGFVRRAEAIEDRRLIYRAYDSNGMVYSELETRQPIEFEDEQAAGLMLAQMHVQIKALTTFVR